MKNSKAEDVDNYIAKAPKELKAKLKEMRKAIRSAVPSAEESISYRMPYYSYRGRLAWFAAMRGYVGLYLRPPIIAEHARELKGYVTTKSAIHFPADEKLPIPLIKRLVREAAKKNETERGA